MSADIRHIRREGSEQLLNPCAPDCPACAAAEAQRARQEKASEGGREIIFGMWLQAIADGERTLQTALEDIEGPLRKLSRFERDQVLGQFTRRATELLPAAPKARKPRGLPTAWRRANRSIVELIAEQEKLPIESPNNTDKITAIDRAVQVWAEWGIDVTPRQVQDACWPGKD